MRVSVSYNHGKYEYCERVLPPSMVNVTGMYCYLSRLRVLPYIPNVEILFCDNNKIKYFPYLPKINELVCYKNKIKDYSNMPHKTGKNNKYLIHLSYLYLNVY